MEKVINRDIIMNLLREKIDTLVVLNQYYYRMFLTEVADFIRDKTFTYVSEDSTTGKCMGECKLLFSSHDIYFKDNFYYDFDYNSKVLAIILEYYYYMSRSYLGRSVSLNSKNVENMQMVAYCCGYMQDVDYIEKYVHTNEFKCMVYRTEFMSDSNKLHNRIDDGRIIEATVEYCMLGCANINYIADKKVSKHYVFDTETCKFVGLNTKVRKEYESKVEVFKELAL